MAESIKARPTCSSCKHWVEEGMCLRFPPTVAMTFRDINGYPQLHEDHAIYPIVNGHNPSCGEYSEYD